MRALVHSSWICLALPLLFIGCTQTPAPPEPAPEPPTQPPAVAPRDRPPLPVAPPAAPVRFARPMEGIVLESDSIAVVAGAKLAVSDARGVLVATAETGPDGRFSTTPLTPGAYVIRVTDPTGAHFPLERRNVDPLADPARLLLERAFRISGVVREKDSRRSVPGVPVAVQDATGQDLLSDVTDSTGSFHLAPLHAGQYTVRTEGRGDPASHSVRLQRDVVDLELVVPDLICWTGLVIRSQPSGQAPVRLADAQVRIRAAGSQEDLATTHTGPDGVFAVEALEPGHYVVLVDEPMGLAHAEVTLEVAPGTVPAPLRIWLEGPATVSGSVVLPPDLQGTADVRLWLLGSSDSETPLQVTYPSDGHYAFAMPVDPGRYWVRAIAFVGSSEIQKQEQVLVRRDDRAVVDIDLTR